MEGGAAPGGVGSGREGRVPCRTKCSARRWHDTRRVARRNDVRALWGASPGGEDAGDTSLWRLRDRRRAARASGWAGGGGRLVDVHVQDEVAASGPGDDLPTMRVSAAPFGGAPSWRPLRRTAHNGDYDDGDRHCKDHPSRILTGACTICTVRRCEAESGDPKALGHFCMGRRRARKANLPLHARLFTAPTGL